MAQTKAAKIIVRTVSGSMYEFKNAIIDKFGDLFHVTELGVPNNKTLFIVRSVECIEFSEVDYEQN